MPLPRFRRASVAVTVVLALLAPLVVGIPSASAATKTEAAWAAAVQSELNSERHDHGLPALKANSHLVTAAHGHNVQMAKANLLSHRCKSEPALGTRLTKAGYRWKAAAENIGWTWPSTQAGLVALQQRMYHEKPPNDGHRRNMLSRAYNELGVDVHIDSAHHKVWLTIDFGHR